MNEIFDLILRNAEKMGAWGTNVVWAYINVILVGYIAWLVKTQKEAEKAAFDMRIKDAESDIMAANAQREMIEQIRELRQTIKCKGDEK